MRQEHIEAVHFMRMVKGALVKWPQLAWLYHIPNGGLRNRVVAGKLKAEGVKPGVADYFLPCARIAWQPPGLEELQKGTIIHGLFLELKAGKNKATKSQLEFGRAMVDAGYAFRVVTGRHEAFDALVEYLEGNWVQHEI